MIASNTRRPRNVDAPRAAAILYGDWGTSKAYVIGLAFAVAGYSSFWLIAAMCLLTALVGVNYMSICKHYPDGGGVYASVRHRSEIISIVGAFLLIADYIVTAAISALSAFQYLGFAHPEIFAAIAIALIGGLNFFGPKNTAGLAFLISIPTLVVVVLLGIFCLPHLGTAVHNLQPLSGGFWKNWNGFVGVVLALSGVEAIANATGVMKLNPGSTDAKPCVSKTSSKAILWVMIEVCVFTALLGLAMHALHGLQINKDDVDAPGATGVRDYMLRYMAQVFVTGPFGLAAGHVAGVVVSIVFGLLLLSAVNTAIVDLIAISYLMSRDGELPASFQKLNKFGVPNLGIIVATVIPAILVLAVKDMAGLADLYAVGVVGAIATNLGASSTDKKLGLAKWERTLMFVTFLIMVAIEISLFADKPSARVFAVTVLAVGLILRGLASEHIQRKKLAAETSGAFANTIIPTPIAKTEVVAPSQTATGVPIMAAIRGLGKTLDFAINEAKETHRPLYLLFVRALPVLSELDQTRKWQDDDEAREIFTLANARAEGHPIIPCYAVSDSVADTIVDIAATMGASHLILGAPERKGLVQMLRGDVVRKVSNDLPEAIHLLVYA
ncbi:amino acid permease [Pedosphaera parvula]|uniref:UspA domain protein n=1 Tax=Pedosphaera parvula (strain Ellin514) TaxID=320771 RepID=B9XL08_PEDPL|nr:amino acid permease [Pedosphaera parvula]EEF59502.1 UspA domain protein [Pedosphaera parvula Ellin514]